jgi:hypothetical protein
MIGQSGEGVGEPGARVDAVEVGRLDQGVEGGGALAALVGAGEGPVAPADGNRPIILPMSASGSKSIIAGTPSMAAASDGSAVSSV